MLKLMRKKWIALLLCLSMAVPVYAAEAEVVDDVNEEVVAASEETVSVGEQESLPAEIAAKEDTESEETVEVSEDVSNDFLGSIPSSFDPRKECPEIIPPVRNQGHYGTCWAHAIMAAAEFNLLKNHVVPQYNNQTLDLSERVFNHIAFNQDKYPDDYDPLHNSVGEYTISSMSYDRPSYYDDGGTPYLSGSVLQRWLGVVPEMDPEGNINPDTYYKGIPKSGIDDIDVKYISPKGGNILAHMENMVYLDKEYRDDIKKYIIKDGALDCAYNADDGYIGSDKKSFYCYDEDTGANHEVALIGWDDDYDRKNFNSNEDEIPKHNGAWLLRNSWDSDWAEDGYFWMSYEDRSLIDITAVEMAHEDDYDNNYYYAGADGWVIPFDSDIRAATVFKVKEEGGDRQQLRAVSIAFKSYEIDYDVKVYKGSYEDLVKNPDRGTEPAASAKGYREYPGVYTIKLDKAVDLQAGEAFSVVFGLKQRYGQPINLFVEQKADNAFVNQHPGEAYIDNDGSGVLTDVSDPAVNGDSALNFRINALTDRIEGDAAFDIMGLNDPTEGTVYDQVSRTVTTKFTSDTNEVGSEIVPSTVLSLKYTDGIDRNKVTLTSSDDKIVKINSDGDLIATGAGRAFITAKYNGNDGNVTAREISVVVKKEIKPGWFVYEKDNKYYWPDNNEIFLRECTNYTAEGDDWAEYEKDKYAGTFTRVPADAYSLKYKDNRTVTESAKATIETPVGSFYYVDENDCTITYSIEKYDPWDLYICFKEGEVQWNKTKKYYEREYTGERIGNLISTVEYEDGTEVDFDFLGYYKYDPINKDYIDSEIYPYPSDVGMYAALIGVDDYYFKYQKIYQVFEIYKQDMTDLPVYYNDRYVYTGTAIDPDLSVRNKADQGVYKDQYTVEVKNNTAVYDLETQGIGDNAPYFVIRAKEDGNYTGTVHTKNFKDYAHPERFYFSILPADLQAVDKKGETRTRITLAQDPQRTGNDYAFTGNPVKPTVSKVEYFDADGNNPVVIDPKYYDISYENNIYPTDKNDMARVTVAGKGIYSGSVYQEFSITDDGQATVTDKVTVSLKSAKKTAYEYTGKPIKPSVVVKLTRADGTVVRELKKNEYTLDFYNVENADDTGAVNAGTWAIAVSPADRTALNFKTNSGTRYTVTPRKASKIKITLGKNKITQGNMTDEEYIDYLEKGADPGVKSVKDGSTVIDPDSYQVTLRNNNSCGTATAEFTFGGNYEGTKEVTYKIVGKKLSKFKFSKIGDQTVVLNSKKEPMEICPEPVITDSRGNQVYNNANEPAKYELKWSNNRNVGKASVLVIGRGIYEGSVVVPFNIVKRKVSDKSIKVGNDDSKNDIEPFDFKGAPAVPGHIKVIDTKCEEKNDKGELEYKSVTLKEGDDYTIKVTDNTKPGTVGRVTVTGIGYYEGQTFRTFDIVDARTYYDSKRDIAKLVESKVLILDEEDAGISDLKPDDDKLKEVLTVPYSGYPKTINPDIYDRSPENPDGNEYKMQPGYDYVINFKNNLQASADPEGRHINGRSTPEIVIEGIGPNYTGSYKITFEIKQVKLATTTVKPLWDPRARLEAAGYAPDVEYNTKAQKPVPHLYYLDAGYENSVYSKLLTELNLKDFTVKYQNNKDISKNGAKLTIKPKKMENFWVAQGQPTALEYSYSIVKGDLANAVIAAVPAQSYKGVRVTPKPAVTFNGVKLKEGRDFVYVYYDNDGYGVGSVSIKPVSARSCFELNGEAPEVYFLIK